MNDRIYYLDNLRVFLTMLVIIFHAAITYAAAGEWYVIDVDPSVMTLSRLILTIFISVCQAFFMGLFFFIAGFFTPSSYEKKGAGRFLKDRIIRLGIPTLLYFFFLGPTVIYLADLHSNESYWHFFTSKISTAEVTNFGPLWFTEALLYFSIGYALYRLLLRKRESNISFPNSKTLLLAALALGATAFLVRLVFPIGSGPLELKLGYFPSYILLYIVGIIAYRHNWLEQIGKKITIKWLIISLITIPMLHIGLVLTGLPQGRNVMFGGFNDQALLYAFWEPFVAIGICLALLAWFKNSFNQPGPIMETLTDSAYSAFIIHPLILVSLTLIFRNLDLQPFMKFLAVSVLSVSISFVLSALIIKLPYIKKVL